MSIRKIKHKIVNVAEKVVDSLLTIANSIEKRSAEAESFANKLIKKLDNFEEVADKAAKNIKEIKADLQEAVESHGPEIKEAVGEVVNKLTKAAFKISSEASELLPNDCANSEYVVYNSEYDPYYSVPHCLICETFDSNSNV